MIRVRRPPDEPPTLAAARVRGLQALPDIPGAQDPPRVENRDGFHLPKPHVEGKRIDGYQVARSAPGQAPPGPECPILLDPADPTADDPLDHIQFVPDRRNRWRPMPRNGSRRGAEIIRTLRLDDHDLLERYNDHTSQMEDAVKRLRETADLDAVWTDVKSRWLRPEVPFSALSRDILLHHFPSEAGRLASPGA